MIYIIVTRSKMCCQLDALIWLIAWNQKVQQIKFSQPSATSMFSAGMTCQLSIRLLRANVVMFTDVVAEGSPNPNLHCDFVLCKQVDLRSPLAL